MDVSSIVKLVVLVVTTSAFFHFCIHQNAKEVQSLLRTSKLATALQNQ